MALDLHSPLKVVSWASAHADCPMRYTITSADEMVIIFGNGQHEFELSLDTGALRTLAQLAAEALAKMDTHANDHSELGQANRPTPSDRPTELEGGAMSRQLTNGRPSER